MPELEKTESGKSWRRQRAPSRPSRPTTQQLERLYSGRHLDDHCYYHHHDHHEYAVDDGRSTLDKEKAGEEENESLASERGREDANEVQGDIPDKRDLESRGSPLEKRTTTRSVKPENIVSATQPRGTLQTDPGWVGDVGWP
jgi:hypothetical protein